MTLDLRHVLGYYEDRTWVTCVWKRPIWHGGASAGSKRGQMSLEHALIAFALVLAPECSCIVLWGPNFFCAFLFFVRVYRV